MAQYRPPKRDDSVTNRELRDEQPKSFLYMICFVYFPIIIFVVIVRALMLMKGVPFIRIPVVDGIIMGLAKDVMDYIYVLQNS